MSTISAKNQEKPSRFYIVNTAKETRGKIETKVKNVNKKYVKKQLENSREFFNELKADPIKKIDDLIDDGKDAIKNAREERFSAWKKAVKNVRTDSKDKLNKLNTKGRKVYNGLRNDARTIMDDAIDMGKKNLDKIAMKKTLEDKIKDGIESIPSRLNLPSRDEIDNLTAGIDGVNRKVDALNKQIAKA